MSKAKADVSTEEAKKTLIKEKKKREDECKTEINKTLQKHNCQLDAGIILKANQVTPVINIISK